MNERAAALPALRRFKPYPAYKDSGVEWLGEIPAGWTAKRLKRVFKVVNGSTPASSEPAYWDGDIPWVTPEDLGDLEGTSIVATRRNITDAGYRSCGTTLVPAGSLVLSTRAPIGHLAMAGVDLCTNQGCRSLVFRNTECRPYYFYEVLAARPELESLGQGSTFRELAKGMLEDVELAVPPEPDQRAIAAFLDRETARIDALVAKKERLIELLQEKRTALITRAVTKGLDPTAPMKDSGVEWLGEIPAHWETARLGWLARIGNGSTPTRDDTRYWLDGVYPWLTSAKINEGAITAADEFVTDTAFRECHLPWVRSGSVLVAITGEGQTRGRAALLRIEATISQHLAYVGPWSSRLGADYLRRQIECRYEWMRSESSGAGSTRAALTCEFLRGLEVVLPPCEEQDQIAALIDRATVELDTLVARVDDAIERLKELRTALISAAVTGKIDVREEVAA